MTTATAITRTTYTTVHNHRTLIVRVLFASCLVAAAWYGTNVYAAISRTIQTQRIAAQADALGNSINQLDAEYIALAGSASPSALAAYGMTQTAVSAYIPRTASLGVAISGHEF